MPTVPIPIGRDGFVRQADPGQWFGDRAALELRGAGSNERRAFLWFPPPPWLGKTIQSATLEVGIRETAFSGQTLACRRVMESWSRPTWNEQPATNAGDEVSAAITAAVGATVNLDVTAQIAAVAAGAAWYGFRLALTEDVLRRLHSKEAADLQAVLIVTYTDIPAVPTDPRPSDGRAVSVPRPYFAWGILGPGAQAEARVQVDQTNDFASPLWDSGWVSTTEQLIQAGADIPLDTTHFWRVNIRDSGGIESGWSEPAEFIRRAKAVVAITSPAEAGTVETSTPNIVHTHTGTTQRALERDVYQDGILVHPEPFVATTDTEWTVPAGIITEEGVDVRVVVRAFDTTEREATPGDPLYVEEDVTFQFVRAAPGPPTGLVASSEAGSPIVQLDFEMASAPAYVAVRRDGILVSDRLLPSDLLVSGTSYRYRDYGATPGVEHTYEVARVIDDAGELKESAGNPEVTHTTEVRGAWVVSPELELDVVIGGHDDQAARDAESAETHLPLGGYAVRDSDGSQGEHGRLSGTLREVYGRTADQWRARLRQIKDEATDARVIKGSDNLPVVLGEPDMPLLAPADEIEYGCTIDYWQSAP